MCCQYQDERANQFQLSNDAIVKNTTGHKGKNQANAYMWHIPQLGEEIS